MNQYNLIRALLVSLATLILTDHFAYSTKIVHQPSSSGESTNLSSVASNGQNRSSKKRPIIDLNMPAQTINSHSMESAYSVYKHPETFKDTASSKFRQPVQFGNAAGNAFYGAENKQQAMISHLHAHTSNPFPHGSFEREQETRRRKRQAALQRGAANKQRKSNPKNKM